ncbi:CPBP family intramembrane glutamic endopeptidase [Tersicoccus phoenicis]|uniref:CPBP family intramembrane glutamic endopeptidase n=1 Tax=Tersicoccus phoenicis TaxID=554083 RepID=UPI00117F5716|nr:CPBP family intramembrane glutamic endopeptidase [Tersicoccus phoenicis]
MTGSGPPVPAPPWRQGPPPGMAGPPANGASGAPPPRRSDIPVPLSLRWANPAQLTPAHPLRPRWSIIDVVLAAVAFLVVPLIIGLALQLTLGPSVFSGGPGVFVSLLLTWAVLLGACLISSRTRGFGSLARDFGLRFRWMDVLTGLIASIGLRLLTAVVAVIVVLLTGANQPLQSNGDIFLAGSSTFWLIINAGIGATLISPLLEELFFRGLLLRAVQNQVWLGRWRRQPAPAGAATAPGPAGPPPAPGIRPERVRPATVKRPLVRASVVAALISAVVFGSAHLGQLDDPRSVLIQLVSVFCIGLVNAGLTLWFGRLGPAVLTHVWFNGTSILLALLLQGVGLAG